MLDADAVINNSSQKVGGSGPRKTHRIYATMPHIDQAHPPRRGYQWKPTFRYPSKGPKYRAIGIVSEHCVDVYAERREMKANTRGGDHRRPAYGLQLSRKLSDWLCLFASKHTQYSTSIQKKQQRQAVREARISINHGRLYNQMIHYRCTNTQKALKNKKKT